MSQNDTTPHSEAEAQWREAERQRDLNARSTDVALPFDASSTKRTLRDDGDDKRPLLQPSSSSSTSVAPESKHKSVVASAPPPLSQMSSPSDPVGPSALTQSLQWNKTAWKLGGIIIVVMVAFVVVLRGPNDASDRPSLPELPGLHMLCQKDRNAPAAVVFQLFERTTNRTHTIYVHRDVGVQITMISHPNTNVVEYTEAIDFQQQRVARFPSGRQRAHQNHDCVIQVLTDELDWMKLACQGAEKTLQLDNEQMVVLAVPQALPTLEDNDGDSFFQVPMTCVAPASPVVAMDATSFEEADHLWNTLAYAPARAVDWLPQMIADVGAALTKQSGEALPPYLVERLAAAFDRMAPDVVNTTHLTWFVESISSFTNASTACCGQNNEACASHVLETGPDRGLGLLCSQYRTCLLHEETAWMLALHGSSSSKRCRRNEHRCRCDYSLSLSLAELDRVACGDCREDERACDCLALSWTLRSLLQKRPCWCMGQCERVVASYPCRTTELCRGHMSSNCELTLHWCPRIERFPCTRCHLQPQTDLDLLC
jgi:hypothetical protein